MKSTPCIGICSTVYGDDICRGCKRHYLEVIDWNKYSEEEIEAVYGRLDDQIETVLSKYFKITDYALLRQSLEKYKIRYNERRNEYSWILELLRVRSGTLKDVKHCGLKYLKGPIKGYKGVYSRIDAELFKLAQKG